MARLIGIGGVFLFADDTERLAQWYRTHLGLDLVRMDEVGVRPTFYVELYHRDLDEVEVRRHIVFAIMPADGTLTVPRNQATVNYRVDAEGNRIELWQHIEAETISNSCRYVAPLSVMTASASSDLPPVKKLSSDPVVAEAAWVTSLRPVPWQPRRRNSSFVAATRRSRA